MGSKSKDTAVLSWGIFQKKMSKMFLKFGQNFDPSKPSKSKDRAVLSWGTKKKLSKMFLKFGQKFDPSKPSKSKDTAVLSWCIFQKKINFVENVSKIWSKL